MNNNKVILLAIMILCAVFPVCDAGIISGVNDSAKVFIYAAVGSKVTITPFIEEKNVYPDWVSMISDENIHMIDQNRNNNTPGFTHYTMINTTDSKNRGYVIVSGIPPDKTYLFTAEIPMDSKNLSEHRCTDGSDFYGEKRVTIGHNTVVEIDQTCRFQSECSSCSNLP